MTARTSTPPKTALVVATNLEALTAFQAALTGSGYVTILARDLPTALLAITQHYFDVAVVSSRLGEGGDGWPLAGILHLVFPRAFIAVLTPGEPDVITFQAAINNGVTELYDQSRRPADVVSAIMAETGAGGEKPGGTPVQ
ncbi:MAG TPA: response regulator [Terriglobales bacterium]|nr:response regulator [Terriglobales bacterium]